MVGIRWTNEGHWPEQSRVLPATAGAPTEPPSRQELPSVHPLALYHAHLLHSPRRGPLLFHGLGPAGAVAGDGGLSEGAGGRAAGPPPGRGGGQRPLAGAAVSRHRRRSARTARRVLVLSGPHAAVVLHGARDHRAVRA